MAQRNGSVDTQKKHTAGKMQKGRSQVAGVVAPSAEQEGVWYAGFAIINSSICLIPMFFVSSVQVKDIPMPSKPAPTPNGAKTAKAPLPKSPSKPTARSTPTKLTAPVKVQPAQSATFQTAVNKTPEENSGPDASAVPVTDATNATLVVESSQLEAEGSSTSTEEPPPEHVEIYPDVISAAEIAAAAEEAERLRKLNGTGMVKLIYESYDELFPIEGGSTTQANIDEVYCLSFVMPNCLVRLSKHPNPERFQREEAGIFDSLVREDPRGTYHDLVKDETYYVVVEQEADQLRRDQEATKTLWDGELQKQKADKDDGRGFESCSCIYGNPCVDEYGCRDWHSRFAVATKNGWKGF